MKTNTRKNRSIRIGDEHFISIKTLSAKFKKSDYTTRKAIRDGQLPPPFIFMGEKGWFAKHLIEFFDTVHQCDLKESKNFENLKLNSLRNAWSC